MERPDPRHPRDAFITVYGRKSVLEVLTNPSIAIDKLVLAHGAHGHLIEQIEAAARARGLEPSRTSARAVNRLSRNARQDQGVAADVAQPAMDDLQSALTRPGVQGPWIVLDGVTTPANVGMIIRTAAAAGMSVVLPRQGCPDLGPLVLKASAGTAFFASIHRTPDIETGLGCLVDAGIHCIGLAANGRTDPWTHPFGTATAFVLGNEARGLTPRARAFLHETMAIPMAAGVESLNVAVSAAVVCFEARRRGLTGVG